MTAYQSSPAKPWTYLKGSCVVAPERTQEELIAAVALRCKADGTIVRSANIVQASSNQLKAIAVTDYLRSDLESQRREFAESDVDACDQMSDRDFSDLIVKATRFSKTLKFYDKMFAKPESTQYFRRGLERIIQAWIRGAYFPTSQLSIAIFTVVDSRSKYSPSEAYAIVKKEIGQALSNKFKIPVSICFKHDPSHMCHPWHLQSDSCTIQFERGFDIIERNGSIKRSFINLAQRADKHLVQYQQLREFDPLNPVR